MHLEVLLLLSVNHWIVPTFNLVFLHVPAVLIAGTTAIATTEVSLSSVDEHVPHQVPLELGHLSTHFASVLLLSKPTAQRKQNLFNVFRFTGSKSRSGSFSCKWQSWRRRESGWTKALHHLERENVKNVASKGSSVDDDEDED